MIKNLFCFDGKLISKYSSALMGLAAIAVIVCHSSPYVDFSVVIGSRLNIFHTLMGVLGNYAVKMFFFLSAIHLYFSMKKNDDVLTFYKRRFTRLLLPYFFIAIFGSILNYFVLDLNILGFLKDYFLVGYFIEGGSSWFVAAIIPMYIVFPLLFKLINKSKYNGLIVIAIWIGVAFLLSVLFPDYYTIIRGLLFGFVAFVLGLMYASAVFLNKKISLLPVIFMLVVYSVINFVLDLNRAFVHTFEVFIPIFLLFILTLLLSKLPDVFNKVFSSVGKISLETYLLGNVPYFLKKTFVYSAIVSVEPTGILFYAVSSVVIVLLAFMFSKVINKYILPKKVA